MGAQVGRGRKIAGRVLLIQTVRGGGVVEAVRNEIDGLLPRVFLAGLGRDWYSSTELREVCVTATPAWVAPAAVPLLWLLAFCR